MVLTPGALQPIKSKSVGDVIEDIMEVTIKGQQDHMYFEMIDKGYKLSVSVSKVEEDDEE